MHGKCFIEIVNFKAYDKKKAAYAAFFITQQALKLRPAQKL